MKPQFLIASASSHSGKTTLTLALIKLLKKWDKSVQAFKCGPDYLDTRHHALASGVPSYNLDTFMMGKDYLTNLYSTSAAHADVVITEGVMGLFDGAEKIEGSSAEISILLSLPVVLVVNARSMAYSAAALIYGFKNFHPGVNIAGVVFNYVNSLSHYQHLVEACEDAGVEALGYIPENKAIEIPSRYLGLSVDQDINFNLIIEAAADHIVKTVDVLKILKLTLREAIQPKALEQKQKKSTNFKIAVARDEAFNFIYPENIYRLEELGKVSYFSPLSSSCLPEADLIYFPGGYPEFYLNELSANGTMIDSIRDYYEKDGRIFAECGGLMYLGNSITDKNGQPYAMAGIIDIETTMESARLTLGYRQFHINGNVYRGHEFHYSSIKNIGEVMDAGSFTNARNKAVDTKMFTQNNVWATYAHLYWGEKEDFLSLILGDTNN